jgi:hypothetical protein
MSFEAGPMEVFVSRTRLTVLAGLAALAVTLGYHSRSAFSQGEGSELMILSTGAIQGEVAPCG